MKTRTAVVILWLITCSSLLLSGNDGEAPPSCPCEVLAGTSDLSGSGIQLHLKEGAVCRFATEQIRVMDETFITHGYGRFDKDCLGEADDAASICSTLLSHYSFESSIDETTIDPQVIEVVPSAISADAWMILWRYSFPAGYFQPGIYLLEGTWRARNVDCGCFGGGELCQEIFPGGVGEHEESCQLVLIVTL